MAVNTVTQYLGLNVVDGGTPQTKRIRGVGTVVSFGPAFGALDVGGTSNDQPINRVVFFNGAMFALVGTAVWRSVDGGLSWNVIFPPTSMNSNTAWKSGLNVVVNNNIIYLCFIYFDSSSFARGAKTTDGVNWSVDGPFTSNNTTRSSLHNDTVFRNQLWCLSSLDNQQGCLLAYNPGAAQINFYFFLIFQLD